MPDPQRGEVWIIDLGMIGKTRPCVVFSVRVNDVKRALVTFVPRTTSNRPGSRFEVPDRSGLFPDEPGVFDAQQIGTVDHTKFKRRVGSLTQEQLGEVEAAVKQWLGVVDIAIVSPPPAAFRRLQLPDPGESQGQPSDS
jgi:mRNA interferase MazF